MAENLSKREIVAAQILAQFVQNGSIPCYGGDADSHRECTDEENDKWEVITYTEVQNRKIKHFIQLSLKIADEFLTESESEEASQESRGRFKLD